MGVKRSLAIRPHQFRLLVTAGPTREMLDPVRFLSNVSTGHMGYEIAKKAKQKGFHVTLISGPTALKSPKGVSFTSVLTAEDMKKAIFRVWPRTDALIMTAAVCDYTPVHFSSSKIKRIKQKTIQFKRTVDILEQVGKHKQNRTVVGFALETEAVERNAWKKLKRKNLDLIVANWYDKKNNPFGDRKTSMVLMGSDGSKRYLRSATKAKSAGMILREVSSLLVAKKG
jgi:phosphopantothenoylcysteine decarboxylase / phosphopantothenate---cysteine ligase